MFYVRTQTELKLGNQALEKHFQLGIKKVLTLLKRIFFNCDILLIEALDKLFVGAEALLETVFGIYV
jgi:hypothetical protein